MLEKLRLCFRSLRRKIYLRTTRQIRKDRRGLHARMGWMIIRSVPTSGLPIGDNSPVFRMNGGEAKKSGEHRSPLWQ